MGKEAKPKPGSVMTHQIPMQMAVCIHCEKPCAKADMPGMEAGQWLHIFSQKAECVSEVS